MYACPFVIHDTFKAGNPDLYAAQQKSKVVVTADANECSFQFNPTGTAKFTSSCDIAKQILGHMKTESHAGAKAVWVRIEKA